MVEESINLKFISALFKMYSLHNICSLCLTNSKTIQSIFSKDNDGTIVKNKVEYVLTEIINFKSEIIKNICTDCLNDLNFVYKFKQKCLQNLISLNNYAEKQNVNNEKLHSASTSNELQNQMSIENFIAQHNHVESNESSNTKNSNPTDIQDEYIKKEPEDIYDNVSFNAENIEEIEVVKKEFEYCDIDIKCEPFLLPYSIEENSNPSESTKNCLEKKEEMEIVRDEQVSDSGNKYDPLLLDYCTEEKSNPRKPRKNCPDIVKIKMANKRAGNLNIEQKAILIRFLKKHPKMSEGKFTKEFTFKDSQKLWQDLSKLLNSIPNGGTKSWKQWRKVWQDLKTKTKTKKAQIRKHSDQTEDKLHENDLTILEIVSEGVKNLQETSVPLFSDTLSTNEENVHDDILIEHNNKENNTNIDSRMLANTPIVIPTAEASISSLSLMENKNYIEQEPIISPSPYKTAISTSRAEASISSGSNIIKKAEKLHKHERTLTASEGLVTLTQKKLDMKQLYYNKKLSLYEERVHIMRNDLEIKKEIANSLRELIDLLKKVYM